MKINGRHVKIEISVTHNWRILARVDDGVYPRYEVTVGGNAWNQGKGCPYQSQILRKCDQMLGAIKSRLVDVHQKRRREQIAGKSGAQLT